MNNTPPDSPGIDEPAEIQANESSQKKRGRKAVRKDRSAAYREIKKQQNKMEDLERRLKKYKKRLERQKKKSLTQTSSPSPRKKVANLVGKTFVSPEIKKQLFVGYALQKQIEGKFKEIKGQKKKVQHLRKEVGCDVIKKYRVQTHLKKIIPYK